MVNDLKKKKLQDLKKKKKGNEFEIELAGSLSYPSSS